MNRHEGTRDPIRRRVFLAFGLVAAATMVLTWTPVYSGTTSTVSTGADGTQSTATVDHRATLLEVNGPGTLRLLAFPLLVAVVPLLVPGAKRCRVAAYISGVVLAVFSVVTGFSIGPIYAAGALAMMLAAALPVRSPAAA